MVQSTNVVRRRATSNYFELDADRRRNKIQTNERFSHRLNSLDVATKSLKENETTGNLLDEEEMSIDFCCERLRLKFGFQSGSIENQREHVLLLLANIRARGKPTDASEQHIFILHKKLMANYKQWCTFLHVSPLFYTQKREVPLKHTFHMDIMLYFLIWGEASNIRHMPECICYLFYQMIQRMNEDPSVQAPVSEGWYLTSVIRPIWKEASNMQRKNALGKQLQHVEIRNYDDINEYFWKPHCLTIPIEMIGKTLTTSHAKTFYEHRSILTLILNYYRIFQFNLMFLLILIVLAFAVAISPDGGQTGFRQFHSLGQTVFYTQRDLKLACISLFFCHAVLGIFKCLLEIAHGWHLLWNQEEKSSSSRSFTYGMAVTCRLLWNAGFAVLFGYMIDIPLQQGRDTELLGNYLPIIGAFILPGLLIVLIQAFSPQLITNTFAGKFIREGSSCYVGRHLAPPLSFQAQYIAFWILLWIIKAFVSFFILVRPLMLPSICIYNMSLKDSYHSTVISFHNIGILLSLWLPVVFIFNYDTQIYFTILQALIGFCMGIRMKTGELRGMKDVAKAFRIAPQLFDQKIVTSLARANDIAQSSAASTGSLGGYGTQMMLRFVVVWNEIVHSFREGDLLDDKEAAILQYDIRSTGQVHEPVFLSAGKLVEAMDIALRIAKDGKGESQLRVALVENDCLSAISSFYTAGMLVLESLLGQDDASIIEGFRVMEEIGSSGGFMKSFNVMEFGELRLATMDLLEAILDLEDPSIPSTHLPNVMIHSQEVILHVVRKMELFFHAMQAVCLNPSLQRKFASCSFLSPVNGYLSASRALVNIFSSDVAMGAATRTLLLLSLDRTEAMPQCAEAQRRLGFFMKSLVMDIPQLRAIKEMRSFSVVTPFYAETVLFSLKELNDPLVNHPIFQQVEEGGKNLTILKYLSKIHPEEWEHFLERIDVSSAEEAQTHHPQEIRLWASYRGQTLARTVHGMMLYEEAIKLLHWLEIGSTLHSTAEQKQSQLHDMVRLKFSYICACQVYGKHRAENQEQAEDIDYLLRQYPNLRVAYVDTIVVDNNFKQYDTVLIKCEEQEIVEVYRYQLPGDPILGEGKPENQNNGLAFTRGEFVQTIDMNQEHYFEECLKMPALLATADLHSSGKPVQIIGMREHIFTGNASSLAKFKTWQELVFVTLSQRVLANPLYCRMHYGHPDVFDKILSITRGGLSKSSKGINLSEDVFAGFNATLRGGVVTHVEFMQCGKGRDVALSQISLFEGKLANGAGETSLAREAHRMGQFLDFFRLNSMYYSHTGFYFATWMTIATTFIYMYSKVYIVLAGVQEDMVKNMDSVPFITNSTNTINGMTNGTVGLQKRLFHDADAVINTQYYIQAGLFLSLPLIAVYFGEMGLRRGFIRFIEMIVTGGPAFFIFQVGTTMHYFDNNLLHGGAKYQATGRGFKITREAFVLLYKAYAASHYRKAFELIGLCFVYLSFGNFHLCETNSTTVHSTYQQFCQASQGFGVQTFAIWFIAILWLISPFLFNTDGLDWEKTKADVAAWAMWMYAGETYKDADPILSNGWIGWWKSELELYHNTRPIARLTVLIRESRHFLLMWYVITLKWKTLYVALAFGAAIVSILMLAILGSMRITSNIRPMYRALVYFLGILAPVIAFGILSHFIIKKDTGSSALSLFFGYMGAMYGINEMARMWSFKNSSITSLAVFRELAFFFDFIFCVAMILPLVLMSIIPFLNVIQTRMMYNKGFSEVVSASSQYAFSLAAFIGVVGGATCGWIYFLFSALETSPDFIGYVTTYNLLNGKAGNGTVTYTFYLAGIGGTLVCGLLNHFIGRRLSIVCGGFLSVLSMMILNAIQAHQVGERGLLPGIGLMGTSVGIILPTITMYIYEVCTYEMRSKAILLLGFGFVIGTFAGAWFTLSGNSIGWLWQIFVSTIMLTFVTAAVCIFPESPYWVYRQEGLESLERCLTILRRKEHVEGEVLAIRTEESAEDDGLGIWFKFAISTCSMLLSALIYGPLNMYLSNSFRPFPTGQYMFANCTSLQFLGALISFFYIDKIDHRRILLATLVPVAVLVSILGYNAQTEPWSKDGEYLMLQIVGLTLYFFMGMGLTAILWLTVVGLFTTKTRVFYVTWNFMIFFTIPIWSLYIRVHPSTMKHKESTYLFGLVGVIVVFMTLLACVGTRKNGMICTKQEVQEEQAFLRRLQNPSGRIPNSARSRNLSRSARVTRSQSNYTAFESPGATGSVPGYIA